MLELYHCCEIPASKYPMTHCSTHKGRDTSYLIKGLWCKWHTLACDQCQWHLKWLKLFYQKILPRRHRTIRHLLRSKALTVNDAIFIAVGCCNNLHLNRELFFPKSNLCIYCYIFPSSVHSDNKLTIFSNLSMRDETCIKSLYNGQAELYSPI